MTFWSIVAERVFPYLVQTHRAEVIANGIHILQGKKKRGREDRRRKKEAEKEKRKRKRKEKKKKKKKQERRRKRIFHQTKAVQQSLGFPVLHARKQAPAGV